MADASENLEVLVNAHSREVYSLLLAVTGNPATAEELTQDVFLVALRKGVRPGPGMRLWLREVARRLAMNELRRKRPESADFAADEPAGAGGGCRARLLRRGARGAPPLPRVAGRRRPAAARRALRAE